MIAAAAAPSVVDHLTHSLPGVGPMPGMAALATAGLAEATSDIVPPVTTAGSSHYLQLPSAGVSSLGMSCVHFMFMSHKWLPKVNREVWLPKLATLKAYDVLKPFISQAGSMFNMNTPSS